ncbi:transcriptional regulator [Natronococcus amylolyticus DSM 10524]|uniref:Transcriptional regulator n=1 Tax=Natronococcus amylolyticus DSM 10524 TaxID=1227497 RepID=L9X471_9EURY|nr:IclR family transcriptional regulator [Natronococcus amylolyticus]ELY55393.1 transcriptional regulator [Natronococcus amylolyticus DSM 10524]
MTADVPLTTVARAFEILEYIREEGGASVSELTDALDVPKSTVHDYVTTLTRLGYLTNDGGKYDLSLAFLTHGTYAKNDVAYADRVEPALEELADETGEIVWYIVEEGGRGVYAGRGIGRDALQPYASIGTRSALHTIAGGKAILTALPDDRVDEIVAEHGLERHTERTITTREELEEARERIAERGYALNDGENIDGWRAVASPVVLENGLYGAIAVAGPRNRLRGEYFEETLPELAAGTANEVQLRLRSELGTTFSE